MFDTKRWGSRKYFLDRMSLPDLFRAYISHPAVQIYALLAVIGTTATLYLAETPIPVAISAGAAMLTYPLIWYLLHRFVLHSRFLYKLPQTATLWKRIHYDHHRDPNDLRVLFGALHTTLPFIFAVTTPIGWCVGGPAGVVAAVTAGLIATCFYEFCHCIQHLPFTPKSAYLRRIKKRHLAHHFHNEHGNFGITNFFWDRVFGTYYPTPRQVPRSRTVFNLGYTGREIDRFPWVAELSDLTSGRRRV